MPQPRKSGSSSGSTSRSSAARKPAAKTPAAKTPAARKPAARSAAAAKPKARANSAAAKPKPRANSTAAAKPKARPAAPPRTAVPTTPEDVVANLNVLRERLISSVTLTTERLQETVDDAVRRGRLTRKDAEELLASLVTAGRQQTEALLADLEQLLGRGTTVRARAAGSGDAVLRTVDRARRRVGVGNFPILNYDDLSAAQITKRLGDLTPAQLRKVRDHERRAGNRKSVIAAVEKKLG